MLDEELALVEKLGSCMTDFLELEAFHPSDPPEFALHVHFLQNLIMSNDARRAHPDHFPRYLVGTNGAPQPNPASRIQTATSVPRTLADRILKRN